MKIGLYGGSFNPPHNGHLNLANELYDALSLDKIIIMPSNISPQKDNNGGVSPYDRINMCRTAFSDEKFEVSDWEIKNGGKSYTVYTLEHLKRQHPNAEFFLFVGSDMLLSFHTWFRFREILDMCTVCAVSRSRSVAAGEMRRYASDVLRSENVKIFDITEFEVSSTEIRKRISEGKSCKGLLPNGVYEYIKENNIYEKGRILYHRASEPSVGISPTALARSREIGEGFSRKIRRRQQENV